VDDEDAVDVEDIEDDEDVVDDFSRESSNACRVLATVSSELLPSTWVVPDAEPLGGPDDILSWMLVKMLLASDRLPDCKALERLCRSLLSGSLLEPPFCDETLFCSVLNAVSALDTLPDWSAVASVLKSCAKVLVLVEVEDVEPDACCADANLSWIPEKILWASDRLPDCRALDRLCRSLLNGLLLEPPFCEETSFCRVDSVVWASVVLPDCRSLLSVAIKLEMLEEVLLEEELVSEEGGGGGAPCCCIICPSMDNPAEEFICANISSLLELLWEVLEEEVPDNDVPDVVVLDVSVLEESSLLSCAMSSLISLRLEALELPEIPLIELVI